MTTQNAVTFTYKNYRGATSVRLVRPIMVSFGTTGFHPEPQWLLHAWDLNKEAERTFAIKDIKDWEGVSISQAQRDDAI